MTAMTAVYVAATVSLPSLLSRARELGGPEAVLSLSRTATHRTVTMPTDVAVALWTENSALVLVPPPPVPESSVSAEPVVTPEPVSRRVAESAPVKKAVKKTTRQDKTVARTKTKSKATTSSRGKSRGGDRGES